MARLDYFAPGVYVEEVSKGSRAIQGVNLSVAGFVGFTEDIRGDAQPFEPVLITSWSQYLENFARDGSHGFASFPGINNKRCWAYLPFAVKGWFDNGGGRCWVVSLGTQLPLGDNDTEQGDERAELALTRVSTMGKKPSLIFQLKPEKEDEGRVRVVVGSDKPRTPDGSNEEAFNTGEYFKITVWRGQEKLEGPFEHLTMNLEAAPAEEPAEGAQAEQKYVTQAIQALSESKYLDVQLGQDEYGQPINPAGIPLALRPANGDYEVRPQPVRHRTDRWYRETYGSEQRKTGVQGLFQIDDVAMVACPDLMLAYQQGLLSLTQLHGILEMMITNCENAFPSPAYRMVVVDPPPVKRHDDVPVPPDQQKPQDVADWLTESFGRRSQFAALYYPWIQVPNPGDAGNPITIPPSGHMMGLWCRTDETRGIHKAPANEIPRGTLGLAYEVNFREQELLNPLGINCIRRFRNRGTLVWGARTLAPQDDTAGRYVSVRRVMNYIEKSIEQETQWAVFEPNDEDLWARITRTVKNFLERTWRQGALFGSTPEEAFYVKCDRELNTPETMKLGQLFIEVGVCPVRPAEFVVFRVRQWDPSQDKL